MKVDRTTLTSLTLTVLVVTSMVLVGFGGAVGTARADHDGAPVYTIRQPGTGVCYEVKPYTADHPKMVPEVEVRRNITHPEADVDGSFRDPDWNGFESIESQMDYRYRNDTDPDPDREAYRGQTQYYAPYLNNQFRWEGWEYATYGKYNWSADGESHLWFYENPDGEVSLVIRHDKLDENVGTWSHYPYNGEAGDGTGFFEPAPGGGTATWTFDELPAGEWAYLDDMYPRPEIDDNYTDADGTKYGHRILASRSDEYERLRAFSGGYFRTFWTWGPSKTDGGAYRGFHNLGEGESVTIDASFTGDIEEWYVRNNVGHGNMSGQMLDLRMDQPVVIERGATCLDREASLTANPTNVEVGESVTFTATAGADEYRWDFDGDGTPEDNTSDNSVPHSYDATGEVQVSVTLVDGEQTTEAQTTITVVEADDPTARASASPTEVEAGAPITLDGSASHDDNESIASYEWSAPGGELSDANQSDPGATVVYDSADEYRVNLTVTDENGNTDTDSVTVTVTNGSAPNITSYEVPSEVSVSESVEVSATASDDSAGQLNYTWTFSRGDRVVERHGRSVSHSFDGTGNATVELVVRDGAGRTDSITKAVTVTSEPDAAIAASTTETRVGKTVTFSANNSTDDGSIAEYHWDFDGDTQYEQTTNESVVSHTYGGTGTFNATVAVEDESGNNGTAEVSVKVKPKKKAHDDRSNARSRSSGIASTGPPPTHTEVEARGESSAVVDVQNGQDDELVSASLPETVAVEDAGVRFRDVTFDLGGEDAHVAFETAASADAPGTPELTATDRSLAYLTLDAKYLDTSVSEATVEFEVRRSALSEFAAPSDVTVYRYDGSWTEVNATVVETTDDAYRLAVTTDGLSTLAVGANRPVSITDAGLANATVTTGETVTATVTVENDGTTARTATVNLTLDGGVAASKTVEVPAGEDREVTLATTAPSPGTYEATVAGIATETLTVQKIEPADVSVADVSLNRSTITAGETVAVTATVENTGGKAGERTVTLTLFGDELATKTVEVVPGETREVTFVQRVGAAGTYTVEVNGHDAKLDVKPAEDDDGGSGDAAPDVPGFGVAAAVVALLAAALLARHRS